LTPKSGEIAFKKGPTTGGPPTQVGGNYEPDCRPKRLTKRVARHGKLPPRRHEELPPSLDN